VSLSGSLGASAIMLHAHERIAEMTAQLLLAEGAIADGLWPLWICRSLGGSTLANCFET
jgi:hypothetical protein